MPQEIWSSLKCNFEEVFFREGDATLQVQQFYICFKWFKNIFNSKRINHIQFIFFHLHSKRFFIEKLYKEAIPVSINHNWISWIFKLHFNYIQLKYIKLSWFKTHLYSSKAIINIPLTNIQRKKDVTKGTRIYASNVLEQFWFNLIYYSWHQSS